MSFSGRTRISVAMCTYNGDRFLSAQLASIAQQTRLPDELVMCDDRSTDQTLSIVRAFADSVSFPVKIFVNEQNLGFAANFEAAIRRCSGELIALSDQDDVWYPQRLERSEQELVAHPEAGVVFSDGDLIDEQDQPLGQTLWQRLGFDAERRHALMFGQLVVLAKHRFVTGATMMFRANLRAHCLPVGQGWIHDEWIVMTAAAFAGLRPIEEPLIRYRVHGTQQVGFTNKLEKRAQGATRAERHWSRVADSAHELQQICDALGPDVLPEYLEHLEFLQFRAGLPLWRLARLGAILSHAGQYKVHASGVASMMKDLALARQHAT
jgi:glycosyltransferase involved in cell wall biosynthesis